MQVQRVEKEGPAANSEGWIWPAARSAGRSLEKGHLIRPLYSVGYNFSEEDPHQKRSQDILLQPITEVALPDSE
jgi:hypothetical protein